MSNYSKKNSTPLNSLTTYKQTDDRCFILPQLPELLLGWIERHANDVVGVWNEKGELQFISENVKQIYGYDSTDLLGTKWQKVITTEEFVYFLEMLDLNQKFQSVNVNIHDNYGNYVLSKVLGERIIDKQHNKVYYVSIIQDISDQFEMQNIIVNEHKNTSLTGQVAASIAHEIRNPLTSLKGFLQLLESGISEKDIYYKIMIEEIEKIETITSDLLLISKPLAKKKKRESVYSMLHDVIVLLSAQAQQHNIKINLPENLKLDVYCDRSQIKQVFINIIKNAIEASHPSGEIDVDFYKTEDKVSIDIIDEGPGVPSQILHKLNEPFFTTKQTGTGLGLMITNQILKQHNGELKINNNKEKGSTFTIILPVKV